MRKAGLLAISHAGALVLGAAAGIYLLPVLTADPPPAPDALRRLESQALFTVDIQPDLAGHDLIHWGEGRFAIGREAVSLDGRIGPGPDYQVYLAPEMVEDEAAFLRVKGRSVRVGDVDSFHGFIVSMPATIDPAQYVAVVVWCETFSRFITAARYR